MVEQSVAVLSGGSHPGLARVLSRELNAPLAEVEVGAFADGETRVCINADVRGATAIVVQSTGPPVNDHLMVLALLSDAARAAGVARIIAVVPYFGYARQEVRNQSGDPRSAQMAARLLDCAGIAHLITLDLHAPALESALAMPATILRPDELFLPLISRWNIQNPVVVSPDAGGLKRAQRFALAMGASLAVVAKDRPRPDEVNPIQVLGDVRDRACIIIDDMASTGRTLASAATALRKAGAAQVSAVFTHAVMAPEAPAQLQAAHLDHVLTSDSIFTQSQPWLEIVTVAPLLARAISHVCGDASTPEGGIAKSIHR